MNFTLFKKLNNKLLINVFILLILLFTLKHSYDLRKISYFLIPDNYSILDERTWVWQGLSIRSTGVPAAWSDLDAYLSGRKAASVTEGFNISLGKDKPEFSNFRQFPKPLYTTIKIDIGKGDQYMHIVQPMIEQPPLGGLIYGSLIDPANKTFKDVSSVDYRKVSLYVAVVTQILIFILGWKIFKSPYVALLSSIIYGSAPAFLLTSRLALLENIMSPLLLLSLIFILKFQETKSLFYIFLSGVFAGTMALVKITGLPMILIGLILILIYKMGKRALIVYSLSAFFISSFYFIWLFGLDSLSIFGNIFSYQGFGRQFFGSMNFLTSILQVRIHSFPFDGWWLGGFITLAFLPQIRQFLPIFVSSGIVILTVLFLGVANYSWYYFPLIPFLCLSTAYFIYKTIKEPTLLQTAIFFVVFASSSFYWGYASKFSLVAAAPLIHLESYRFLLVIFMALLFFPYLFKSKKFLKKVWLVTFVLILLFIYKLNDSSMFFMLSNWGNLPTFPF